jgi:hypothetical protein
MSLLKFSICIQFQDIMFLLTTMPMVSNHGVFSFNLPKMDDGIDKCYKVYLMISFVDAFSGTISVLQLLVKECKMKN